MQLNQREQYVAKIAGTVLGVAVLYLLIVEPLYTQLTNANTSLDESQVEIIKNQGTFANNTALLRGWNEKAGKKITRSLSAADAQLNDRIRVAAQSVEIQPQFDQSKNDIEKGFGRISRPIQISGNMNRIGRFVYLLQNSDIPIRINELTISSKKEGTDDLTVVMNIATIYELPAASNTTPVRQGAQ